MTELFKPRTKASMKWNTHASSKNDGAYSGEMKDSGQHICQSTVDEAQRDGRSTCRRSFTWFAQSDEGALSPTAEWKKKSGTGKERRGKKTKRKEKRKEEEDEEGRKK